MNKNFIFVSIFGWGLWSFFNKIALQKIHPLTVQLISCAVGFITFPVYLYYLNLIESNNKYNIIGVVFTLCASIISIFSSLIFLNLLKKYPAGLITVYASVYPAITVILSIIFLGETMTIKKFLGMLAIFLGLFLVK